MMKRILMLFGIYVGALAQLYLPSWPAFGGMKPPLLAALALYYAFHCSWRSMWLPVFWAALLHDSLDPGPFGPALLAFPAIAVLANRIRSEIFVDGVVTQLFCGALGGMIVTMVAVIIYGLTAQRPIHPGPVFLRLIGSGLLGAVALPVVSGIVKTVEGALPKRREYGWQ